MSVLEALALILVTDDDGGTIESLVVIVNAGWD